MALTAQQLFGNFNPDLLQQQIRTEEEKNLLAQAQLSPEQMQNLIQLRSGAMLSRAASPIVESLFGVQYQDPRMRQMQEAQSAYQEALTATGGDANSPDFFKALSNAAARRNLTTLAQQSANQAATLQSEMAQAFSRTAAGAASMAQATRERTEAPLTIADRIRLQQLQQELGPEAGALKFRQERDEAERRRAAAAAPQPSPTEKAILPGKATQLNKVEEAALQSTKTIETANSIDRVLNSAFVGFGADAKLRVGQIAQAFGATVTGTSETEQLKQLLAQLAQGQARSLPGALSEKELAFLREAIGTGNFTLNTLRSVTRRLRVDALASDLENQEAQKYISAGNDLNKFDFAANKKKALELAKQQMSEREAKERRLEELRAKQGGR